LLDVFEDEKYLCLVIELMEGGELYDYVKEKNHLSESEAKEVIKIMIDALSYCH
jgi:serine/threonine protein kinase